MEFCNYCGDFLTEDGRCPDKDCIHNLLMDIENEVNEENKEDKDVKGE